MASKKNPSIFATLQKTTESASAVNGEFTRQLPLSALLDNPMNRFSMAEDEEFLSTLSSVEKDGFLEDIIVTPDEEGKWRIISGHRRVMAARKLGKTYATLVREANPYDGGAKLGADTLLKIMELSRDVRPLQYMAEQFGMTLVKDEGTSVRAGQHAAR
jgi:hypothetical protein